MVAKVPYDIERDFQPIALVTRGHLLLAISPTVAITSVPQLIAEAKKNPGKLLNASSSNGSPGHVGGELFKFMTGTDIVHVPYRGGANAINDLIRSPVRRVKASRPFMSRSVSGAMISNTSPPEQKLPPAPVSTTALTSSHADSARKVSRSSA